MAEKKTPRGQGDDPRFEEFLRRQFSQLRQELDQHTAKAGKQGKVLSFEAGAGGTKRRLQSPWMYGVAAVVLAAVAVPLVLQLNQQKAELAQNTQSAPVIQDQKQSPAKAKPKKMRRRDIVDKLEAEKNDRDATMSREEAAPKDLLAKGNADARAAEITAEKKEAAKPAAGERAGYAMADEVAPAPRAPAAMPAPTAAKSRSAAPASEAMGGARSEGKAEEAPGAPAEAASRSVTIDDAQHRLKNQQVAEDEKAEMERLWKEFEKNPEKFSKDKQRSARLKTLLARHETRSKSRAKRVKAAEAQYAH